jgi:hypothetical protein
LFPQGIFSKCSIFYYSIIARCISVRKKTFGDRFHIVNQFWFTIIFAYIIIDLYKNIQAFEKLNLLIFYDKFSFLIYYIKNQPK